MSDQLAPDSSLALTITPTRSDLGHFARLATRRLPQRFFVVWPLLFVAAGLALSDGDAGPFVSGMIAGVLAVALRARCDGGCRVDLQERQPPHHRHEVSGPRGVQQLGAHGDAHPVVTTPRRAHQHGACRREGQRPGDRRL